MKTTSNIFSSQNWLFSGVLAASLIVPTLSNAQEKIASTRYRLLVDVTRYNHAELKKPEPLRYPEIDAKAVRAFLEKHDCQADYLLGKEATKDAIASKLKDRLLSTRANNSKRLLYTEFLTVNHFPQLVRQIHAST